MGATGATGSRGPYLPAMLTPGEIVLNQRQQQNLRGVPDAFSFSSMVNYSPMSNTVVNWQNETSAATYTSAASILNDN